MSLLDTFQQVAQSPDMAEQPQTPPQGQPSGLLRTMQSAAKSMQTEQVNALQQARMAREQARQAAEYAQAPQNPLLNAGASAFNATIEPLARGFAKGVNLIGHGFSPEAAEWNVKNIDQQPNFMHSDPTRFSGKVGAGLGMAAETAVTGGAAVPLMAAQGMEEESQNIDSLRRMGVDMSQQGAVGDIIGQGALQGAVAAAAPGGRLSKGLLGNAAKTTLGSAGRVLGAGAIGAGEMTAANTLGNVVRQQTVNPNQELLAGNPEAAITGAVFHGVPRLGVEAFSRIAGSTPPSTSAAPGSPEKAQPGAPAATPPASATTFSTGKGSVYEAAGGGYRRTKASGEVHEPHENTVFLDPDTAQSLVGKRGEFKRENGKVHFTDQEGNTQEIPHSTTPELGKHPLEFEAGRKHLGNQITSIGEQPTANLERVSQESAEKNVLPVDESKPLTEGGPGRPHTPKSDVTTTPEELARIQAETERLIKASGGRQWKPGEELRNPIAKAAAEGVASDKPPEFPAPDARLTRPRGAAPIGKESNPLIEAAMRKLVPDNQDEVPHGDLTTLQKIAGEQAVRESEGTPAPKPESKMPKARVPNEHLREVADSYNEKAGLPAHTEETYEPVDEERAARIAKAYDAAEHNPNGPKIRASYDALKRETLAQYQHLKDAGYKFTPSTTDPYPNSAAVHKDLAENKHLGVYAVNDHLPADHPLAEALPAEAQGDGFKTYNDVFRAVHDAFGHGKEGTGFGPSGEEGAWRQHAQMYSPEARPAMTAETRGQNSWVNFGPHGEANRANPKQTKFADQKATILPDEFNQLPGDKTSLLGRLATEEHGWDKTTQAFFNRDVVPAAKKTARGITDLAKSIDRHLDAGFTHTKAGDETRLDFRKMQGKATIEGHKFEADLAATGARELAPKFSTDRADAIREWEHWENGGLAKTPEERAAQELIQARRQENAVRAKKVGVTLKDEEGEALSRLYEFPEDHGEQPGKPGSLAGREAYRKAQKIDSFGDSLRAAEAAGGKIKYDSLIDAQIARQYEVERSLAAREALRSGEDKGRFQWVPESARPGDTLNTKINDPIATETRTAAVPSQLAGRLSSKLKGGHYAGEDLIRQHQDDIVYVRPGEDAPKGYTKIAHEVKGTYHGDSDSAHALNSMMKAGSRDPVTELPSKIANATLGLHYGLSVVHGINGAIGSLENDLGRAFGLGGADAQSRSQSLINLMTGGASKWIKGNRAIRNIESGGREFPGMSEAAQRAVESGDSKMRFQSVLDRSRFKDAVTEFKNNNVIGGTGRMFDAVVHRVHDLIFHDVLDRLQMGGAVERAEQDIRQGVSREAGASKLANANDVMARALGRTVTSPEFKNSVVTAAARIVMPAVQYRTGLLRNLGAAIRGNSEAQAQAVGHVLTTLIGSALGGMAVRAAMTGKIDPPKDLRDWFGQPRTGGQDDQGNATRFSLPGTSSFTRRMLLGEGPRGLLNELTGMLHPAIRGGYETLKNKDYYGNQVRPEGWAGLATPSAVGHTLEGALPMSMTNALNDSDVKHGPGERALQSLTGINISHPVTSDAKQYLYDKLNETQHAGRTPEEAERHTNTGRWAEMIRTHDPAQVKQAQEEMAKDPGMGDSQQKSVFRRAAAKKGLAGLLGDSQFGPEELMQAWSRMSDEEKTDSKEAMVARLSKAKPHDRETLGKWLALKDAVTGGGK